MGQTRRRQVDRRRRRCCHPLRRGCASARLVESRRRGPRDRRSRTTRTWDWPRTCAPRSSGSARARLDEDAGRGGRRPGADDRNVSLARVRPGGAPEGPRARCRRRTARPDDPGLRRRTVARGDGCGRDHREPVTHVREESLSVCVPDVVREHAARRGDHVAVRVGDRALTYAQLDERSSSLAQALRALGVREGSRVAHLDRTGPEVVELLFAASKLGAVIVPLNWRLAPPELRAIVGDARARVILAGEAYAEVAADLAREPELVVLGEAYERLVAAQDPID